MIMLHRILNVFAQWANKTHPAFLLLVLVAYIVLVGNLEALIFG